MNYYTKKQDKIRINISIKSLVTNLLVFSAVVAVIVTLCFVPKLRDRYDPVELRQSFLQETSDFQDSFRLMKSKNFNFFDLNKTKNYANRFAGFFKLDGLCDDYLEACLWNNLTYRTLDGEIVPVYLGNPNVGQFRTRSGALYMIYKYENDLWVFVDINGIRKKPNRFGLDTFAFVIDENGASLRMMGAAGTPFRSMNLYCNPYVSNKYNGLSCPLKALMDENYFVDTLDVLY